MAITKMYLKGDLEYTCPKCGKTITKHVQLSASERLDQYESMVEFECCDIYCDINVDLEDDN